jgi:hypothetical protein
MARGSATVVDQNLNQQTADGVENKALFIGVGVSTNIGEVVSVNSQSDLDVVLGPETSVLKTQVRAAQLNGGAKWFAWVYVGDPLETITPTIVKGILDTVSPELVFWCITLTYVDDAALGVHITWISSLIVDRMNTNAQRFAFIAAVQSINPATQTWAAYQSLMTTAVADVLDKRIYLVPQLHGNNLGVLAGRLCRHDVSIADSPMRVATGPVVGLGTAAVDTDDVALPEAVLEALDGARYTVTQAYPDFPGVYFSDANSLDGPTGDFSVIEYLRPVDKAARAVRLLMIAKIANREFNSTPASTEAHKTYFAKPLREMARTRRVGDVELPGDIMPPDDESITIIWTGLTSVEVFIKVRPYTSPKDITTYISLDLSN